MVEDSFREGSQGVFKTPPKQVTTRRVPEGHVRVVQGNILIHSISIAND